MGIKWIQMKGNRVATRCSSVADHRAMDVKHHQKELSYRSHWLSNDLNRLGFDP